MAEHILCDRTTDQILEDFDAGSQGRADVDMREVLWQVIDTVRDSYALAMRSMYENPHNVHEERRIAPAWLVQSVEQTVEDFVANAFGDD